MKNMVVQYKIYTQQFISYIEYEVSIEYRNAWFISAAKVGGTRGE